MNPAVVFQRGYSQSFLQSPSEDSSVHFKFILLVSEKSLHLSNDLSLKTYIFVQ